MLDNKLPRSWVYASSVPTDEGSLDIRMDEGGSATATWTSASSSVPPRSGWGLSSGDARVIFGRSAGNLVGVVIYTLLDGKLEALWTQTAVNGAIGTGTATRVDGDTGEGFNGRWTIIYVNPDGSVNPPYGLEIGGEGATRRLYWTGSPDFHGVGFIVDGRLCVGWGLTTEEVEAVLYSVEATSLHGPTASTASPSFGVESATPK